MQAAARCGGVRAPASSPRSRAAATPDPPAAGAPAGPPRPNALGGTLPTVVQVYADPTGLDPGTYQGTVTIGVAGSDPPQRTVPVTFNVGQTLPPTGSVDPASLSFSLATGGGPLTRQINVT